MRLQATPTESLSSRAKVSVDSVCEVLHHGRDSPGDNLLGVALDRPVYKQLQRLRGIQYPGVTSFDPQS